MIFMRYVILAAIGVAALAPITGQCSEQTQELQLNTELISILALNTSGEVMVEAHLLYGEDWLLLDTGDPLSLEHGMPLSVAWRQAESTECPIGSLDNKVVTYQILIRPALATTRCPYPMHPTGRFYAAELNDGGRVVVRFREEDEPASVVARVAGSEIELSEFPVEDLVELQLAGDGLENTDLSNVIVEYRIAELDTQSWKAHQTSTGQSKLLHQAAEMVVKLLEIYYERNGRYPGTMCQLYAGPDAIVSAIPRNPFDWDRNLCDTEYAPPHPKGVIRYFPQRIEGDSKAVGYWLAVIGEGVEVKPDVALPADIAPQFRVIRWLEKHPE